MRILLAQLAPVAGEVSRNADRLDAAVRSVHADLAVFPELYLSGYRVGDRFHQIALTEGDRLVSSLRRTAKETGTTLVVGAPLASKDRRGEVRNAALAVTPTGELHVQVKRYLPNFGPFEEGVPFTPTDVSAPVPLAGASVGLQVCYDAFFPEVSRQLALGGAEILVVISASPVTSARFFERLLPARAIENALPAVFVNRVGVEDGMVFAGGSAAWDARGELMPTTPVDFSPKSPEEWLAWVDVDLAEAARYRPFRPVLRDVAQRPGASSADPSRSAPASTLTRAL